MSSPVRKPIDPEALDSAAAVIRCVGHPLRLRLLEALEDAEHTVSELQHRTGASQAAVSEQLGVLRGHNIVGARRVGPFVYYRILEPRVIHILACIRDREAPAERRTP